MKKENRDQNSSPQSPLEREKDELMDKDQKVEEEHEDEEGKC